MKCLKCGEEIKPNDKMKFCPFCGSSYPKKKQCPSCKEEIDEKAKFCPYCGYSSNKDKALGVSVGDSVVKGKIVGGSEYNIFNQGESKIVTKTGEYCKTCGSLLKDNYFKCMKCNDLHCTNCRDSENKGLCEGCGNVLKERQQKIEKERQQKIEKERQQKIEKKRQQKIEKKRQQKIEQQKIEQQKIEKEKREKEKPSNLYSLRKTPITISEDGNYKQEFGLNNNNKPFNYINNEYKDNKNGTITDNATGLIWQKSGSKGYIIYNDAKAYIKSLNNSRFAGQNDWRLPTIPELISLLEPSKKSNDLYINPVFDKNQSSLWSSDQASSGRAWYVDFLNGEVYWNNVVHDNYVRGVRCRQ